MEFVEYTIGELALEVKTGKTPPTSNPEYFDGDIPWIGPSDLKGQKYAEDSERKITEIALEDNKSFLYQSGTVLISTIGDIGKTAIVKKPVASNQQLTGILVNEDIILPELFYYWIRLNKRILENKANTAVISMLNNKLLKRIKVVFPKYIEDQYKIVGRLNRIQEFIDKRVETIQLLDEYIRSIFLEMFGDPILNNKKFPVKTLENIVVGNISYGVVKSGDEVFDGVPFVRPVDLGEKWLSKKGLKSISNVISEQYSRTILKGNELLISVRGRLNAISLVSSDFKKSNVARGIVPLKFSTDEERIFYYYFLTDPNFKIYYNNLAKGVGLTGVNISDLKQIPLFDMNKNKGLLSEFYELSNRVDVHKKRLIESSELLNILFQATLQNAFSEESQIDEDEVFESLLQTFTKEDLKQGDRLKHLLKWIDCKEPRFSQFESYNLAWDRLRELLEDGSIEQVMDKNEIKLKVVE
ncbi:restriction endonuclease subunit S [uncultured Sunxiuqinia sp.]|uniref:restriction endonuclease subunit S n=1 Tax=uncultured Sunxiuqinia sp. TaxID=1573825 RepID=UPI002AA940A0|nr:restriction endonuclease subunit S [uncultured Sunxiuqinia sp.]